MHIKSSYVKKTENPKSKNDHVLGTEHQQTTLKTKKEGRRNDPVINVEHRTISLKALKSYQNNMIPNWAQNCWDTILEAENAKNEYNCQKRISELGIKFPK